MTRQGDPAIRAAKRAATVLAGVLFALGVVCIVVIMASDEDAMAMNCDIDGCAASDPLLYTVLSATLRVCGPLVGAGALAVGGALVLATAMTAPAGVEARPTTGAGGTWSETPTPATPVPRAAAEVRTATATTTATADIEERSSGMRAIVALWVIAAVSTIGSAALVLWTSSPAVVTYTGASDRATQLFVQVAYSLMPFLMFAALVLVGMAIVATALRTRLRAAPSQPDGLPTATGQRAADDADDLDELLAPQPESARPWRHGDDLTPFMRPDDRP
ncbi:hypothetical protein NY547_00250 [Cnuibacter physcomitrellae]|uniref:hypothetical protein n=1 Tax=Cnuibacter physcomitrellae TaxID=1619308 RepID=UPI002175BC2D|nr:hypothetical protein [Cnuibacter physcomitrellae]MCS5495667.1 hypothetical protein [Cnuibacter physcomitrellae]